MEKNKVIEGNQVIAKWMGMKEREFHTWDSGPQMCWYDPVDEDEVMFSFDYHTSWDRLMPVVQKINAMDNTIVTIGKFATIIKVGDEMIVRYGFTESNSLDLLTNTYTAVLSFIEHLNGGKEVKGE